MGLDMYLDAEVYFFNVSEEQRRTTPVQHTYRLGQWWRCDHLHDYIVDAFADGELHSQEIVLGDEELQRLLTAIKENALVDGNRPIFSRSKNDMLLKRETIDTLTYALEWLKTEQPGTWRSVQYRASW